MLQFPDGDLEGNDSSEGDEPFGPAEPLESTQPAWWHLTDEVQQIVWKISKRGPFEVYLLVVCLK